MGTKTENFFDANMAVLKEAHPHVWTLFQENHFELMGEIRRSPSGKLNLVVTDKEGRQTFLHDQNDPEAEVPQFLAMVPEESTGFIAMVGMGLAYAPMTILKKRPYIRHLAVFDRHPGILFQAMHHLDLTPLLSDPRLLLGIGPEPDIHGLLIPATRALLVEAIHTLKHVPSFRLDPAGYDKLYDKVFSFVNDCNVGGGTLFAFGGAFLSNRLAHLTAMPHNRLIDHVKGAFTGKPAILVAGGPSLDKNIHVLAQAKNKAVIIAADTVLTKLIKHGVRPDFVTSIDMEEFTFEKIAGAIPMLNHTDNIGLICSSWVTPRMPKTFPASQVYWTFTGRPLENRINMLLGGSVSMPGAKTVAHLSLQAAVVMGCSPIIFIGQDLAFSDDKDHADGTVLTNQTAINSFLQSSDVIWVDGVLGNKVPTNRGFFSMKAYFEQFIAGTPGHYINATEGGAYIDGTEVFTLQQALDQFCMEDQNIAAITARSAAVDRNPGRELTSSLRTMLSKVNHLRKLIKKADARSITITRELAKLQQRDGMYTSLRMLPKNLQQMIIELNKLHDEVDAANQIWEYLDEITLEGVRRSERHLHVIKMLEGKPDRYIEWLLKSMERLDEINGVRKNVLDFFHQHLSKALNHFSQEAKIRGEMEKQGDSTASRIKLAKLYMESEDIVLAQSMLKPLDGLSGGPAEISLFLGMIAACQTEFDKAEFHFREACQKDSSCHEQIITFRKKMGDTYIRYAERLRSEGYDIGAILLRGLQYCESSDIIRTSLKTLFEEEMKRMEAKTGDGNPLAAEREIRFWYDALKQNKPFAALLTKDLKKRLCCLNGFLHVRQNHPEEAAESYERALDLSADDPELHLLLADVYFAAQDFTKGIVSLDRAVALDRNYARYWENIGDNLSEAGQPLDAIAAYERCILALPEHLLILKKMGDCHMAADQLPAALEAYQQFKVKSGIAVNGCSEIGPQKELEYGQPCS